jgi:Lon protease-like protein
MSRLPLFPLGFVLFPGARAPLHVFEDRYRALLRDVLAADGTFGILLPEADGVPSPGTIGVRARVLSYQGLPDGRSNLLVEGDTRFILTRLRDDGSPYLVGEVELFDDEPDDAALEPDAEQQLRGLAQRCRQAMATLADAPVDSKWSGDPAVFTFQVAGALPWDAAQARPLLAMRRVADRAGLLLRVLPGVVPDLEQRAAVHRRAGGNGKGPSGDSAVMP